jgi:hypothetical protein
MAELLRNEELEQGDPQGSVPTAPGSLAANSPGDEQCGAVAAEAALYAELDVLRAEKEALAQKNRNEAKRFASAEASWTRERKLAEARVLKAQIAAAEARQELHRKKREQGSAVAEHASGANANAADTDTIKSSAAAALASEARLMATAAIARDMAGHFREALLSVANVVATASGHLVAANSSAGVALKCATPTDFIDLLHRYTDENLSLVEELSRPDSEASREVAALFMRTETGEPDDVLQAASVGRVAPRPPMVEATVATS